MSSPNQVRVTEARLAARSEAAAMGITAELISDLVETFYGHIRSDEMLGPVFAGAIPGEWGPHLATMKSFWSAIMFHDGGYAGRPMPAHVKLKAQISPDHFDRWLSLFGQALDEIGATPAAKAAFQERANRIAASFQAHLFYDPYENS
ncbi:group III truncated hemoglobin [Maricaulis maris]|uniref:Hemoglobin n=1 Tax=Maricaulis maris TaxID=74318 RepID=A0A495DMK6_9PROT|nr:group III truncated hemoglobin [Maricaulis maris]RKR04125.1 hemoglobin [Maricaulis maris]